MARRGVWAQLFIGWFPVWGMIGVLIFTVHTGTSMHAAALLALRLIVPAAALGWVVQRQLERFPWRRRITPSFVAGHVVAAFAYSVSWLLLSSLVESVARARLV